MFTGFTLQRFSINLVREKGIYLDITLFSVSWLSSLTLTLRVGVMNEFELSKDVVKLTYLIIMINYLRGINILMYYVIYVYN